MIIIINYNTKQERKIIFGITINIRTLVVGYPPDTRPPPINTCHPHPTPAIPHTTLAISHPKPAIPPHYTHYPPPDTRHPHSTPAIPHTTLPIPHPTPHIPITSTAAIPHPDTLTCHRTRHPQCPNACDTRDVPAPDTSPCHRTATPAIPHPTPDTSPLSLYMQTRMSPQYNKFGQCMPPHVTHACHHM